MLSDFLIETYLSISKGEAGNITIAFIEYLRKIHRRKAGFNILAYSYGGHTVRTYTQENREDLVGMVLIDTRPASVEIPAVNMSAGQWKLWEFLARCGLFR